MAIQGAVNTVQAYKKFQDHQEVQANLLKRVLSSKADLINGLVDSVLKLKNSGNVGTRVNTTA